MAVWAQVVGPRYFHAPYRREDRFGAQLPVNGLPAASARQSAPIGGRLRELQELAQRCGPSLMHRRTHRHLDGFHIQTLGLAPVLEDDAQQLRYFARDFLLDRFRRFFSWADDEVSSTGRN
jgi:hypothetical protein